MMDEEDDKEHFNLKSIQEREKRGKKKKKRNKPSEESEMAEDIFQVCAWIQFIGLQ